VVISAIGGAAGIGKTALAVHWAHRVAARFPDGRLFVDLRGYASTSPVSKTQAMTVCLRALGVAAAHVPVTLDEQVVLYRTMLAGRRVLVVLDNAASDEQVQLLLPAGAGCGVLITSVEPLAAVPVTQQIDLGPFDVDDALAFLRRAGGRDRVQLERPAALELIDSCGRFPLALRILSLQLSRRPHWSLHRMVSHLHAEGTRLDRLQAGALQVRPALDRLFEAIEEGRLSQIQLLADLPTPTFSADAVGRFLGVSESLAEHILEHLFDRRLLEIIGCDAGRRAIYSFPPLTRLAARELGSGAGHRAVVEGLGASWSTS